MSPPYLSLPGPELSQWLRRCQKSHQLTHGVVVTLLYLLKSNDQINDRAIRADTSAANSSGMRVIYKLRTFLLQ